MAIVKVTKDEIVIVIDKEFKISKSGNSVSNKLLFSWPKQFLKDSKNGNCKIVSFKIDDLKKFLVVEQEKDPITKQMEEEGITVEEDICADDYGEK
ncbi:MAG: hypothetical protein LBC44_03395 [Mycoplasmataceae bacterium]|nr:hypothetical protein [Mycoplasmataceae bacterium]